MGGSARALPLFVVVLVLTGCSYVNIGDSVGLPVAVPQEDTYPSLVGERLGASTANDAVKGQVIQELIDDLRTNGVPRADMVTVSIGGNDVLLGVAPYILLGDCDDCLERTSTYLKARYLELFDILAAAPGKVVVLTIYNPIPEMTDDVAERYLADLNDFISVQACVYGLLPARVDRVVTPYDISFDLVHLNQSGQSKVAEAIWAAHC